MFSFSIACSVLFALPMWQEFICYFRFLVVLDKHLIVSLSVLEELCLFVCVVHMCAWVVMFVTSVIFITLYVLSVCVQVKRSHECNVCLYVLSLCGQVKIFIQVTSIWFWFFSLALYMRILFTKHFIHKVFFSPSHQTNFILSFHSSQGFLQKWLKTWSQTEN